MSRRSIFSCALVLSSLAVSPSRDARAQAPTITVTIVRRTAVRSNPSFAAQTIGFLNPSTLGVTQLKVEDSFVRIPLRQIDRRWPATGYGYIAAVDVDVDSGAAAAAAPARPTPPARAPAPVAAAPSRPDSAVAARPAAPVPPRRDTTTVAKPDSSPRPVAAASTPAPPLQPRNYDLETTAGLRPVNTTVEATAHDGKRGVRVVISDEGRRRYAQLQPNELLDQLVVIDGTDFTNGTIEAEIAGAPAADAGAAARGFVGIAFRLQPDLKTYDAFYLRPTNGRAEEQERRNHAAQYISHPAWTWQRTRQETPSRYEAYVDLVPDAWTPIRIEVHGTKARLFVNNGSYPTLVVNDVKTGAQGRGAIALWIDPGTVAHFRNVRVAPSTD